MYQPSIYLNKKSTELIVLYRDFDCVYEYSYTFNSKSNQ